MSSVNCNIFIHFVFEGILVSYHSIVRLHMYFLGLHHTDVNVLVHMYVQVVWILMVCDAPKS